MPFLANSRLLTLKRRERPSLILASGGAIVLYFPSFTKIGGTMTVITNDHTRKAADIRAEKRAAALRENLKKRKAAMGQKTEREHENAKPETSE
jgi:uncharacterized protein (DUF1786 family)